MKFIKHIQGAIFMFVMSLFALTVLYSRAVSMPHSFKYDWWVMLGGFFIIAMIYAVASIFSDWQIFKETGEPIDDLNDSES